ncbi:RBP11-like subunit of RNA polymerase [Dacryopinax primogenitus]|uniref:DNA-directed RNA polymerases I and III subunit RPAC1 n=1 Tax=Dacryopinax primogenitus (strain DJM 731) TaxID=1858805 RepID=M5G5V5_DACPD|nr:RBP11-like subunit of RNA polymerase [Dacryopinax primogenitus]EJU04104.1 RBP11-like subunit of RNA polymerase [Dacryopinax primogenitus]
MPEEIHPHRLVHIASERVSHVSSTDYPGHWPGESYTWDLEFFRKSLQVDVKRLTPTTIDFDLVGTDAAIANALRRIMIGEVETIAVENVWVWQNTSVMQDEVLASRLGLVPLRINPARLESWTPNAVPTDANTISFEVQVTCTSRPFPPRGSTDPSELYENSSIYASHLRWKPVGAQAALPDWLADPPSVAKPDIVLVKLRPGQELNIEMHCVKSCGRDHAKYSPVATATYRLLPYIQILKPIPEQLQAKFMQSFSPGVMGKRRNKQEEWEVFVKDARKDTMSRNVFLYPEFEGAVKLTRVRDHFLFTIESAGQMAPNAILPEAIAVFRRKLRTVSKALDELMHPPEDAEPEVQEGGMELDA